MLLDVGKVGAAYREKVILMQLEGHSKFGIQLKKTFKDDDYLYFVFEHCPFGTLNDLAETFEDDQMPQEMV